MVICCPNCGYGYKDNLPEYCVKCKKRTSPYKSLNYENCPPEVLSKIFGHLNQSDLLKARLVCSNWNDTVISDFPIKYTVGQKIQTTNSINVPPLTIGNKLYYFNQQDLIKVVNFKTGRDVILPSQQRGVTIKCMLGCASRFTVIYEKNKAHIWDLSNNFISSQNITDGDQISNGLAYTLDPYKRFINITPQGDIQFRNPELYPLETFYRGEVSVMSRLGMYSENILCLGTSTGFIELYNYVQNKRLRWLFFTKIKDRLPVTNIVDIGADYLIAVTNSSKFIYILNVMGKSGMVLQKHTDVVNTIIMLKRGLLVSGGDDGHVCFWRLQGGRFNCVWDMKISETFIIYLAKLGKDNVIACDANGVIYVIYKIC